MSHLWFCLNYSKLRDCCSRWYPVVDKYFFKYLPSSWERVSGKTDGAIFSFIFGFVFFYNFFYSDTEKQEIFGAPTISSHKWSRIRTESHYFSSVICLRRFSKLLLSFFYFYYPQWWSLMVVLSLRAIRDPWGVIWAEVSWLASLCGSIFPWQLPGESC